MHYFFVIIGLILGFTVGLNLAIYYLPDIYQDIGQDVLSIANIIVLALTAIFIAAQALHTRRVAEFTVQPKVDFRLMSGKSFWKKNNPTLEQKLQTIFIVHNHSDFPLLFWTKIELTIDGIKKNSFLSSDLRGRVSWYIYAKSEFKPCNRSFLRMAIMNEEKEEGRIDENLFNQKRAEIKDITAHIKISYAPASNRYLKSEIELGNWHFYLDELIWRDCNGMAV